MSPRLSITKTERTRDDGLCPPPPTRAVCKPDLLVVHEAFGRDGNDRRAISFCPRKQMGSYKIIIVYQIYVTNRRVTLQPPQEPCGSSIESHEPQLANQTLRWASRVAQDDRALVHPWFAHIAKQDQRRLVETAPACEQILSYKFSRDRIVDYNNRPDALEGHPIASSTKSASSRIAPSPPSVCKMTAAAARTLESAFAGATGHPTALMHSRSFTSLPT